MSGLSDFPELKQLQDNHAPVLAGTHKLKSYIDSAIESWDEDSQKELNSDFPFEEAETHKFRFQRLETIGELDEADLVNSYANFCGESGFSCDKGFWYQELVDVEAVNAIEAGVSKKLLFQKWGDQIKQVRVNWELETLNKLRQALLSQLEELLKLFEELTGSLEGLGVNPGVWLDLSDGNLTAQDIEQFKHWANYLKNDPMAQEICDLLGRMRDLEKEERLEKIFTTNTVDTWVPDINAKEEIVGIRLSQDIENVIPSELALLADPVTSILFDLKFIENQLMTFDMVGLQKQETEIKVEEEQLCSDEGDQGPMILCIDTSGSMHGQPETIAKAVSLFLATKAREKDRPCYLINFSTGITTLDLSGKDGLTSLMSFLSKSFRGGLISRMRYATLWK